MITNQSNSICHNYKDFDATKAEQAMTLSSISQSEEWLKNFIVRGDRTRDLALQVAGHDDLWLHLQSDSSGLRSSGFRLVSAPW